MFNWACNELTEWMKIFKHLPSCHQTRVEPSTEVERTRDGVSTKELAFGSQSWPRKHCWEKGFSFSSLGFTVWSFSLLEEHFKQRG